MARILLTVMVAVAAAACSGDSIAEPGGGEGMLTFLGGGQQLVMSGEPQVQADRLEATSFAAAFADSLSGVVITGFRRTGEGVGDLLVLQAPRSAGTYTCADGSTPCSTRAAPVHGRYISGMREDGTGTPHYFHLLAGTLVVTAVGPDRFRATFEGVLEDDAEARLVIENGAIDVPYAGTAQVAALLSCLAGAGTFRCE